MESVPKIVRERLQVTAKPGEHPDANLLTAFAEKSLTQRERTQVLDHLALCVSCREIVSLALPEFATPPIATIPVRQTSWFSARVLRWGTLAACVAVAGTAVLIRHQRKESPVAETYISAVKQPAPGLDRQDVASYTSVKKLSTVPTPQSPPASASITRDRFEAPAQEKPRLTARELDSTRAFTLSAPKRAPAAADTPVFAEKSVAPPSATSSVLQKPAEQEELKKEALADKVQAQNAGASAAVNERANSIAEVGSVNEAVTVETQPAQRTQAQAGFRSAIGSLATMNSGMTAKAKDASSDNKNDELHSKLAYPKTRWQISSEGKLMRSHDLGESWQPVQVADNVVFRALSVSDREVWVGGSHGNLFHSSDAGTNWEPIKPSSDGQTLTTDISQIQFSDSQHGTITTTEHQAWTTSDGGHSWHKQ